MKIIALFLILLSLGLPTAYSQADSADTVFTNGNVYTVNERAPKAEAMMETSERREHLFVVRIWQEPSQAEPPGPRHGVLGESEVKVRSRLLRSGS